MVNAYQNDRPRQLREPPVIAAERGCRWKAVSYQSVLWLDSVKYTFGLLYHVWGPPPYRAVMQAAQAVLSTLRQVIVVFKAGGGKSPGHATDDLGMYRNEARHNSPDARNRPTTGQTAPKIPGLASHQQQLPVTSSATARLCIVPQVSY